MIGIIVRGMAVGVTEIVPGVSGSTVAMIVGIYERLLHSLSILTTRRRREAIPFLLTFGVGMMIGFTAALYVIDFLLDTYRTQTMMFFVGIIVGFLPYLWKETVQQAQTGLQMKHYAIMALSLCIVVIGQMAGGFHTMDGNNLSAAEYIFIVISGMLASTALALPGISGSLILTILGLYETATTALMTLNLPIIAAIGSGMIAGVLFISKLIRYLLANYPAATYAAMVGLVSGSIFAIFHSLEGTLNSQVIIMSLLTFLTGVISVILLNQTSHPRSE
ncbi:DUF368 domain-containing protein [Salibacterium halotolerans]|uniref:Putative membrane protein n=1 Tax=Salibacterium halotolerans TaxID=1884432 RepID=A0A1I5Y729_9BACI|nr:DUF368 domain-containing protein [Salibacterium halotolerans]SFQ40035.1 putative membrane protein [Salibacterium halotolerans]